MNSDNPFKSPNASTDGSLTDDGPHSTRLPYAWSLLLLVVGGGFLLLLNGQVFTIALVFLGFAAVSAISWLPFVLRWKHNHHRRLALYVVFGHLIVMIAFSIGLPEKYRWQKNFNNFGAELRQRTGETIDR